MDFRRKGVDSLVLNAEVSYSDNFWVHCWHRGWAGYTLQTSLPGWAGYTLQTSLPVKLNCRTTLTHYIGPSAAWMKTSVASSPATRLISPAQVIVVATSYIAAST
ncbi:MAG: hypothetical protein AAF357_13760 [Verrucomicrobiota bacterium]